MSKIQIKRDSLGRIHLIDDYTPYGALIFDVYDDRVIVCQDAEDQDVRTLFENINESAIVFVYDDEDKDQIIEAHGINGGYYTVDTLSTPAGKLIFLRVEDD